MRTNRLHCCGHHHLPRGEHRFDNLTKIATVFREDNKTTMGSLNCERHAVAVQAA